MDRFDDIWKDRFNEEELPVGDWNTPDDEVWNGILPHVAPEKKKKRRWWWLWFGIGSLLILMSAFFLTPTKNKAVSSEDLKEVEASRTFTSTTDDPNIVNTGINMNSSSSSIESETMSVNISPSKVIEKTKSNNKNTLSKLSRSLDQINVGNKAPISKSIITDSKTVIKPNSPESSSFKIFKNINVLNPSLGGKNEVREQSSISMLPSLEILLQKRILPFHDFSSMRLVDIDFVDPAGLQNEEKKLSFGFSTGAIFWKHRVSENYTDLLSPFDFNYDDAWGWQSTLKMNYKFNEFLEGTLGFQYEQVNTNSGHNSDVTYSLDNELNTTNPLNEYVLSLATPYGLSESTFNLIRSENLSSTDTDLQVDFHSAHTIKNISVPVGLNVFPIGKKKKIVPSVYVGFGTNYLADISNNIQSIDTHHSAIQFDDSGSSTFLSPELQKWHFDYRLGLGFDYQINQYTSIQLNYDWSRGINPIFKLDDFNTRIDRHHISLGAAMKIK